MTSGPPLRVGIAGAGRTRQGLGPYFAKWFEAVGARIVAVSGRDLGGARRAAAEITTVVGHDVAAAPTALELARSVDLLVVASPVPAHLDGLDAALAANVPCLCEKPLVSFHDEAAGRARIAAFAAKNLLLAENCQWPFVLPALFELHPGLAGQRVDHVAMGLSPIGTGFSMIEDSLSHVLSLVQGLGVVRADTVVGDVRCSDPAPSAPRCVVSFSLASGSRTVAVTLHLESHPRQPRPAWFAVNNVRIDRRIGENYALSFVAADGRATNVTDPLHQLVYRLALQLQAEPSESTRAFASPLDDRLRLYAAILRAIEGR